MIRPVRRLTLRTEPIFRRTIPARQSRHAVRPATMVALVRHVVPSTATGYKAIPIPLVTRTMYNRVRYAVAIVTPDRLRHVRI